MKSKILIVEDEKRMSNLIKDFLIKEDFDILQAFDGNQALDLFFQNPNIDLILLDVMLPKRDGWSVLRDVKNDTPNIPIIMLTARSQDSDEIFGFDLGADDYITKPFNMKILIARINALLNRSNATTKDPKIEYSWIILDSLAHKFYINEKEVLLTPIEYDLLVYLLENKNIALSREKILNNVWGYDYFGDIRTVDTHIKRLRKKIKPYSNKIKTIRGLGYSIEG